MQSNQDANSSIQRAISALKNNQISNAFHEMEQLREKGVVVRDVNHIRAICLAEMNRPKEALDAIANELSNYPDNSGARELEQELQRTFKGSSTQALTAQQTQSVDLNQLNAMATEAIQLVHSGRGVDALKKAEEIVRLAPTTPGVHYLRVFCLNTVGRHEEALVAAKQELEINPGHEAARQEVERLTKAISKRVRPQLHPEQRSYGSSLARDTMLDIQNASHNYTYRGVPIIKNPFDWAIYPILLWEEKPRTIIEIGSKNGGSALWLGDMMNNYGIDGHIYSLDIVRVSDVSHPRVTFMEANGRELSETLSPEFMASLPRPLLVIEDADHSFETSFGVLSFFKPHMKKGEYIVIEDGVISDMEGDKSFNSGPHRALKRFFGENPGEFDIDSKYADYFGYNLTWCTNGFLKYKGTSPDTKIPKSTISEFLRDDVETSGLNTGLGINERFAIYSSMSGVNSDSLANIISIGSNAEGISALVSLGLKRISINNHREVISSTDSVAMTQSPVALSAPVRFTKVPDTTGYVAANKTQYDVVSVESSEDTKFLADRYNGMVKKGGYLIITSQISQSREATMTGWTKVQTEKLYSVQSTEQSSGHLLILKKD